MARTPAPASQPYSIRLDATSIRIADALVAALGIERSDVFRLALRVLAAQHGVATAANPEPEPPKRKR